MMLKGSAFTIFTDGQSYFLPMRYLHKKELQSKARFRMDGNGGTVDEPMVFWQGTRVVQSVNLFN